MQSILEAMQTFLEGVLGKLSFIERRSMNENMKPHEAMRQIMNVFDSFDPEGDATWPLRSIRDIILDYLRALSLRYTTMSVEEKVKLCHVILVEAAKRHVGSLEGSVSKREKFKHTVHLCTAIEKTEMSYCLDSQLFPAGPFGQPGPLNLDTLDQPGYHGCPAYVWLCSHGSIEGQFEMQTVLLEVTERTRLVTARLTHEYLQAQAAAEQEEVAMG